MSKKTIYLIGIALTIIIGTYLYSKYCCNVRNDSLSEMANLPANYNEVLANKSFNLSFSDFNFKCSDNFRFAKDDFKALIPVGDSIDKGINTLKLFIDKNPDIVLTIKGFAIKSEKNSSGNIDLGLARAEDVKKYFVSKGINSSQILTIGELCDFLIVEKEIVYGAINFNISQTDNYAKIKSDFNTNPVTVLFKYNKFETSVSSENNQKIIDLVITLNKYSNSELIIFGHTDNIGSNENNIILGEKRAVFLKDVIVKNGFSAEKIKIQSKGEEEPVDNNNTEKGRANNRRAIVNIK